LATIRQPRKLTAFDGKRNFLYQNFIDLNHFEIFMFNSDKF